MSGIGRRALVFLFFGIVLLPACAQSGDSPSSASEKASSASPPQAPPIDFRSAAKIKLAPPPAAKTNSSKNVSIPSGVLLSLASRQILPDYPKQLNLRNIGGTVRLSLVVGSDGSVREATPLTGNPELAKSAVSAVQRWRFESYYLNGQPQTVQSELSFEFEPDSGLLGGHVRVLKK